ncbi:uncharacterized protein atf7ip2 isoform X2 [Cynoglossus semilaevis]|uniref:Activating transcription factor 7 interacting protein 2 n=1 Tax=Cynoglossus semilaevis TaxID=244447 RepID=A0A3P8WRJ2_CYNSE|nr:activating transcription factor 7-interacting protein 2 isoform X2 [Cynoglossus semilaevis]
MTKRTRTTPSPTGYLMTTSMNKSPPWSSSESSPETLILSRSEVRKLIDQEVSFAVKRHETKLRGLIETIQHLDHKIDYESSIQKLEARMKLLSKRAEVAFAYKTRTQTEVSNPFLNISTSRLDPEDECGGNRPDRQRRLDCKKKKKRKLSEMMETTARALNKLHAVRRDAKAVITDLVNPIQTLQYSCPEISPFKVFEHLFIKEEPRDPEIDADMAVEPRTVLNRDFFSATSSISSTDTDMGGPNYERLYPPLPTLPFPTTLNMEAASYSIPQKPVVHVALVKDPAGLSVLWKVEKEEPTAPPMATYSIYMTTEKRKGSNIFLKWSLIDEVKAFKLPMCVMITKYKQGHKLCVSLLGKDIFGRYGPFSDVVIVNIPE